MRHINKAGLRYYLPITCIIGILSFYIFYPGILSYDSKEQWVEATHASYSGWHPPIMSWWWGWLAKYIWYNTAVLLLFHLLMFWSGVYVLGRTLGATSAFWAYLSLGLWFIPPIMRMTAILWKDTGMTCSWFLACALMTMYHQEKRRPGIVVALLIFLLLFYGTAARYNAFTALPPLCYWFALCLHEPQDGRWRTLATAIILCVSLLGAVEAFNVTVISKPYVSQYNLQKKLIYDLDAMSQRLDTDLLPPYLHELHQARNSDVRTKDQQEYATLKQAYSSMIWNYPGPYLTYRWELFQKFACIRSCAAHWWNEAKDNAVIRIWAESYLKTTNKSIWYANGLWLLVAIGLLIFNCVYTRGNPTMLQAGMLNASAVMYMLPYFIIEMGTSNDIRYIYWTVLATASAMVMSGSVLGQRACQNTGQMNGIIS